jgi:hypothetical protein
MKSDSESLAPGEKLGELYVSVSERCCSAITRLEIRYFVLARIPNVLSMGTYRSQDGIHEFVEVAGTH